MKLSNAVKVLSRNRTDLSGQPVSKGVSLERFRRCDNVGDYISSVIFDWMLEQRGLKAEDGKNAHLFGVGSILGFSRADGVVWGSGILQPIYIRNIMLRRNYVRYDIRAVRGPITRDILAAAGYDCSRAVFGDPGILLPKIMEKPQTEKKYRYCVINHFDNADFHKDRYRDTSVVSAGSNDYRQFITSLCEAEIVISSSLHGIIFAEAYRIPAIWLLENMEDRAMKYYDYYYATGRYSIPVARSVEEAMEMEPIALPKNLEQMQADLIGAFPYDLWEKQ